MWIIPKPLPFSPSAQAGPGSISASSWPFPQLARCAGLNGKPSPSRSWFAAWKRASWMRLLCSRTCDDSTASRSVSPGAVVDRTIRGTCGHTFDALLKKCNPRSFSLRTCRGAACRPTLCGVGFKPAAAGCGCGLRDSASVGAFTPEDAPTVSYTSRAKAEAIDREADRILREVYGV